jgi:hypothetical protein
MRAPAACTLAGGVARTLKSPPQRGSRHLAARYDGLAGIAPDQLATGLSKQLKTGSDSPVPGCLATSDSSPDRKLTSHGICAAVREQLPMTFMDYQVIHSCASLIR